MDPRRIEETGRKAVRWLFVAVPLAGCVAVVCAVTAILTEGSNTSSPWPEQTIRGALFVLSMFVGSYSPVDGQPPQPSLLSATALLLALIALLSAVGIALAQAVARRVWLDIRSRLRERCVVIGDTEEIDTLAAQLRSNGVEAITVGKETRHDIPLHAVNEGRSSRLMKRVLNSSHASFAVFESTVDGAIIASSLREKSPTVRIHQRFDWNTDRLTFRGAIRDGRFPKIEVFSPSEVMANSIVRLVVQVGRQTRGAIRVAIVGEGEVAEIFLDRLHAMKPIIEFTGQVSLVDSAVEADIVLVDGPSVSTITTLERLWSPETLIVVVAPLRYFEAVDREDIAAIPLAKFVAARDDVGCLTWRNNVVIVDPVFDGYSAREIGSGLRWQWARTFHNAHSDWSARNDEALSFPNRWFDEAPHPRLEKMAVSAVNLMLYDFHIGGYQMVVREGEHDELDSVLVESIARHIHEQFLDLVWEDENGRELKCANFYVAPDGQLRAQTPPPSWNEDSEAGRERNREIVRTVFPATVAAFGYRITSTH